MPKEKRQKAAALQNLAPSNPHSKFARRFGVRQRAGALGPK